MRLRLVLEYLGVARLIKLVRQDLERLASPGQRRKIKRRSAKPGDQRRGPGNALEAAADHLLEARCGKRRLVAAGKKATAMFDQHRGGNRKAGPIPASGKHAPLGGRKRWGVEDHQIEPLRSLAQSTKPI